MDLGWKILIPSSLGWFMLLAAQRVGREAGWDQMVVTIITALVLIAGYGLLQAAQHVSRANREKDGASF
jgi:NADH-quinone oxidoreductase subunit H